MIIAEVQLESSAFLIVGWRWLAVTVKGRMWLAVTNEKPGTFGSVPGFFVIMRYLTEQLSAFTRPLPE